jgi:uncharacterized membrane protein YgaE (UPF0421/DUF939 family)
MLAAYDALQQDGPVSGWTSVQGWAVASGSRLRASAWSIGQCAVGAMIAWGIASVALNHPRPFFAPVASVVCLGVATTQRLRRVAELGAGVTIGVLIAEFIVREIGNGWWQIGLVVLLAMSAAQLFGGGNLVTNQSAVQSIFLVALHQQSGSGLYRWEDALIGGACALIVAAALPADPIAAVRPQAQMLIRELALVCAQAATALRTRDATLADAVLDRARHTSVDVERWKESLRGAEETSRISPLRRHRRADLERYRRGLGGVDLAVRNMRVAVRRVAAALDGGEILPPALAEILDDLSGVLSVLEQDVGKQDIGKHPDDGPIAAGLTELAARLDPAELGARSLSANVIVGQLRSAVVDLLGATGMELAEARSRLPGSPPFRSSLEGPG